MLLFTVWTLGNGEATHLYTKNLILCIWDCQRLQKPFRMGYIIHFVFSQSVSNAGKKHQQAQLLPSSRWNYIVCYSWNVWPTQPEKPKRPIFWLSFRFWHGPKISRLSRFFTTDRCMRMQKDALRNIVLAVRPLFFHTFIPLRHFHRWLHQCTGANVVCSVQRIVRISSDIIYVLC